MPKLTITRFRALIRSLNYVVSIHAAEGLDDANLTILDLEKHHPHGPNHRAPARPPNPRDQCVIRGFTLDGLEAETIVKLGPTGRLVVITLYLA